MKIVLFFSEVALIAASTFLALELARGILA